MSARAKRAERELLALLGERLRKCRTGKGLTLQQLAEKASLSVPYLSAIERGVRNPTYLTVVGIAKALGKPPLRFWSRGPRSWWAGAAEIGVQVLDDDCPNSS
jgi:transcriptional regulator with XRE-family HTH domain